MLRRIEERHFIAAFFLLQLSDLHMVEHEIAAGVSVDIYSGNLGGHHGAVCLVPAGLASVAARTAAVGVTVGEALGYLAVGLYAFGMGVDYVAQKGGIQLVACGAVELEKDVS